MFENKQLKNKHQEVGLKRGIINKETIVKSDIFDRHA